MNAAVSPSDPDHTHEKEHGFFEPFVFPFRQKKWGWKMWWLPLLDYIPIINVIIYRGWRSAMVRRMAHGESQPLPDAHLGKFFIHGIILWTMTFLYSLVPLAIIAMLGAGGLRDMWEDVNYLYDYLFTGKEVMGLSAFLTNEFWEYMIALAVDSLWLLLSIPLYRAAMIRHALTGSFLSFFNVPANLWFMIRNFKDFLHIYVFAIVSFFIMLGISAFLLSTVIGAVIIPLVSLPVYYWSTASEYGFLARKLALQVQSKVKVVTELAVAGE